MTVKEEGSDSAPADDICTDCGGTGITFQTERQCSCQTTNNPTEIASPMTNDEAVERVKAMKLSDEVLETRRRGLLAHVIRGCGDVPGYGEHPGTLTLAMFVLMGAAAGARAGWVGVAWGAGVMLLVFGPMYLWGAYERSRDSDRSALSNLGAPHV